MGRAFSRESARTQTGLSRAALQALRGGKKAEHRSADGQGSGQRNGDGGDDREVVGWAGQLVGDGVVPKADVADGSVAIGLTVAVAVDGAAAGVVDIAGDVLLAHRRREVDQLEADVSEVVELTHVPGPGGLAGCEDVAVDVVGAGDDVSVDERAPSSAAAADEVARVGDVVGLIERED